MRSLACGAWVALLQYLLAWQVLLLHGTKPESLSEQLSCAALMDQGMACPLSPAAAPNTNSQHQWQPCHGYSVGKQLLPDSGMPCMYHIALESVHGVVHSTCPVTGQSLEAHNFLIQGCGGPRLRQSEFGVGVVSHLYAAVQLFIQQATRGPWYYLSTGI
jgi:hypothetical protein